MALDIDDLPQAKAWLAERGVDLDGLMAADDAVQIASGRKGRAKLLYRLRRGQEPIRTKQIAGADGEMILEFRCASATGLTMQDVLPPSIHPDTGQPYQWAGSGSWRNIPEILETLLDVWRNELTPATARPTDTGAQTKSEPVTEVGPVTIQHLRSALLSMRSDDHGLWVKAGLALKCLGDVGRGLWMGWSQTSEKSQDRGPLHLSRTWDGFTPTSIDYRFVFAEAQRQGWVNPTKVYASPIMAAAEDADGWAMPQPLPGELRRVKALDVGCLPSTVRDAVQDIAERLSCPVDYVAGSLLVGAGALVGNRVGIMPKQHDDTWEVYPAFWGGIVGPPGSMKTPVQQETMRPLRHIEEQEGIAYASAVASYQAAKKQYDKDLAAFKAGKLTTIPPEPVEPKKPRLVVNDTTYQALGEILAANPRGVLVHGDELSGLLHSLDTAGQEAARGFYLSAWGGNGSYTFDRIGRGSIHLTHYALSVFGGFQPDKIKHYVRMAQSGSAQNDGLLQRFQLLVWPDQAEDFILVDRCPNQEALAAMNRTMLGLRSATTSGNLNKHGSWLLHFDEDAQFIFNQWLAANEKMLRGDDLGPAEQSHFSKYRSLVPGLALLFHLLEGHAGAVCSECLSGALGYAKYLKSHAMRVYGAVHSVDGAGAHALAKRLLRGELLSGFRARSVYTRGWRDLSDQYKTQQAIEQLVELGWLTERGVDTGGRKTLAYDVNPRIFTQCVCGDLLSVL
jgi:putative DNA primase/helicase